MSNRNYIFIKNIFDKIFSLILLFSLVPLYINIYIVLLLSQGFPILFKQERAGYKGKSFKIYKFRTMRNIYDSRGILLPDIKRITKVGSFLRSSSLDELPSIINILFGQMSFVGPRPLPIDYLPLYSKKQSKRHDILPGLTGWSQCNGRNSISWDEKFNYDIWYVKNINLFLDLYILIKTIFVIFNKKTINANIQTTMEPFKGNKYDETI